MEVRDRLYEMMHHNLVEFKRCILQFATGTGKTKIALEYMLSTKEHWDIIVPKIELIQTWLDEIEKFNLQPLLNYVDIYCYDSLHKHPDTCNVCCDEIHHITDIRFAFLAEKLSKGGKFLGLSATIDGEKKKLLKQLGVYNHHYVIFSTDDAVESELVTDYRIYAYLVDLDVHNEIMPGFKFPISERRAYDWYTKMLNQAKLSADEGKIKFWALKRHQFLSKCESKNEAARFFIKRIPDNQKALIFGGLIPQIESLCDNVIHSKTERKAINRFREGLSNKLGSVAMLDEGVNLMADIAVTVGLNSKHRRLVQRLGRLLRKDENDPNKKGIMIIIISKNTIEEKYLMDNVRYFNNARIYNYSEVRRNHDSNGQDKAK